MRNAFNARPVLDRVTDGLTLIAMVGLTAASAAAYAFGPSGETEAEPVRLPLVVVTAKKVAEPVMLPQVVVTARRT